MLADADVRARIALDFVAVQVAITDDGFPGYAPALSLFRWGYESQWWAKFGYTMTVICDPDGSYPLGWSGDGRRQVFWESAAYQPDRFLSFLERSLECRGMQRSILESGLSGKDKDRLLKALLATAFDVPDAHVEWFLDRDGREIRLSGADR